MATINMRNIKSVNKQDLKKEIKQVALICLKKISCFSLKIEEVEEYIENYLIPILYEEPLYWLKNPLVKLIKEHVGNELPPCFLNLINSIEEDTSFINALNKEKRKYEQIVFNDFEVEESDIQNLVWLLELFPNFHQDEIYKFIFRKIIDNKVVINEDLYLDIFKKYAQYFLNSNNLGVYLNFKNIPHTTKKIDGRQIEQKLCAVITNRNKTYIITFNLELISRKNIIKNLKTLYHEVRHFIQEDRNNIEQYFYELFIMDKFLNIHKGGYYKENYERVSYETDAFYYELVMLLKFLTDIKCDFDINELLKKIKSKDANRKNLRRIDTFGNETSIYEIFEKRARSLNINPYSIGLIYTFDVDGRRLSPLEIYHQYQTSTNISLKNYYLRVLKGYFSESNIENFITELEEELKSNQDNSLAELIDSYKAKRDIKLIREIKK